MYVINKITSNPVVDFAAEELKKYLRMMMPRCGEIKIKYAPEAKDGFRLGLMQDFSIDVSEAKDPYFDDILHVDTDEKGGIIAGSNPRSVLLAVYKYLTLNGCRWLFPGTDGEWIPIKGIEAVKYHKMADCRYRGQCNEGAEYQPNMMEAIDFTPKIGMNIFMMEFDNPKVYYDNYYDRAGNESREKEPISADQALQWKRQCEAEIAKRGLQFHDMGHGWSAMAFDGDTTKGWAGTDPYDFPPELGEYVAMMDGERKLKGGSALMTNFCMSNPAARVRVTQKVADYAESSSNVDFLHVWLADSKHNHCECENCRKKTPSDWYVDFLNDIDAELKARNLPTRIGFCCYVDTTWAPIVSRLNDPSRFSVYVGAITRDYTESVSPVLDTNVELPPYELNKSPLPKSVDEYLLHAKNWMECCHIPAFATEYHFLCAQYQDLAALRAARIIHGDVRGYRANGFDGINQDGSQRSFFPTGFNFYVYASTLFDTSVDFEKLKEDYFSHAFGKDWREVEKFLCRVGELVPFGYLYGKMSKDSAKGSYYNPEVAATAAKIPALVEEFSAFVEAHRVCEKRAETVSYKLLRYYLKYLNGLSKVIVLKASGKHADAKEAWKNFAAECGAWEIDIERWFDQRMFHTALTPIFTEVVNDGVVFQ